LHKEKTDDQFEQKKLQKVLINCIEQMKKDKDREKDKTLTRVFTASTTERARIRRHQREDLKQRRHRLDELQRHNMFSETVRESTLSIPREDLVDEPVIREELDLKAHEKRQLLESFLDNDSA